MKMTIEKLKDLLEIAAEDIQNELDLPRMEEGSMEHIELMIELNTINGILKLIGDK